MCEEIELKFFYILDSWNFEIRKTVVTIKSESNENNKSRVRGGLNEDSQLLIRVEKDRVRQTWAR